MKSVLISIRPWWCLLIAQGKKTIEVRKTIPKLKPPFKVYIYCTNTKPFLVWGDVFRGNWETEFTNVSGYSRERAEKIWDLFNGKVMGEFVCDEITYFGNVATDPWERLLGSTHEEHKRLVARHPYAPWWPVYHPRYEDWQFQEIACPRPVGWLCPLRSFPMYPP